MTPRLSVLSHALEVGRNAETVCRVQWAALHRKPFTALEAPRLQHAAAILGAHSSEEPVHALTAPDFGLPGSLHEGFRKLNGQRQND